MRALEHAWYSHSQWTRLLSPLACLFTAVAKQRRAIASQHAWQAPVPVIVVGNIVVGGAGKTPVVIALITLLREAGFTPGVVSRGYGAQPPAYPYHVLPTSPVAFGGDEPTMIVQRTGVPLVIDPDRPAACRQLLAESACDIIISDDGLQHYALQRDIEIVVIDSQRGLGNRRCLPAGPLREPVSRLDECDFVVLNGQGNFSYDCADRMTLVPSQLHSFHTEETVPVLATLAQQPVHAIAGIGHPDRFFKTLEAMGFSVIPHRFADHYPYQREDVVFNDGLPVIMTEKDAVKCRMFELPETTYYLSVDAHFDGDFAARILNHVTDKLNERLPHG